MISIFDTLIAPGSMTDRGELSRPRLRIFRYSGIMPPEKNMVKVMKKVSGSFPFRLGRESG